jgi:hypothetical protein
MAPCGYLATVARVQVNSWRRLGEHEEHRRLFSARLEHLVEVREPLVLVSQIQRSGGTLLSQLFDGHPECHAHPYELKIGHPGEQHWPSLDLARPDTWFDILSERKVVKHFLGGYRKGVKRRHNYDVFAFLFLPRLQQAIFEACVAARPMERERDVLDCYFTSYFNAWLDNQNLYTAPMKAVTGFVPRMGAEVASVERFFDVYPDGTLVSIVRDPRGWFESARKAPPQYDDVEVALGLWRRSAEAALDASARYGDRVLVLTYEQLVLETEATMARVAERIGIAMSPQLLTPTFNGMPIRANSSEPVDRYGVLPERAAAYKDSLAAETIERIDELADDVYARAEAASLARV